MALSMLAFKALHKMDEVSLGQGKHPVMRNAAIHYAPRHDVSIWRTARRQPRSNEAAYRSYVLSVLFDSVLALFDASRERRVEP